MKQRQTIDDSFFCIIILKNKYFSIITNHNAIGHNGGEETPE